MAWRSLLVSTLAVLISSSLGGQIDYLPSSLLQDFLSHMQVQDHKDSLEQQIPYNALYEPNVSDHY